MSYLKGLSNSVQSQGGFKKWPISDVDPLLLPVTPDAVLAKEAKTFSPRLPPSGHVALTDGIVIIAIRLSLVFVGQLPVR